MEDKKKKNHKIEKKRESHTRIGWQTKKKEDKRTTKKRKRERGTQEPMDKPKRIRRREDGNRWLLVFWQPYVFFTLFNTKKYPYHTQSVPIRKQIKNCNFCPSIRMGYVCTHMIRLREPVPSINTLPKKLYQYILGLTIQNDLLFLCLPWSIVSSQNLGFIRFKKIISCFSCGCIG